MNQMEWIRTRKSVRTFDGRTLSDADREQLAAHLTHIQNPYDIPVTFVLLDAKAHGLSSPVIQGAPLYIAAKVPKVPHCEEAYGYAFADMMLFAWSLGIGTTMIGGTMKRALFEQAAQVQEGEAMFCMSPLGYPAQKRSLREAGMRAAIKADTRKPDSALFFDGDFTAPLTPEDETLRTALEAVRLAPSAVNKQPWRIVRRGSAFHFYEEHSLGGAEWDMQKLDMGIALYHFQCIRNGAFRLSDPGIPLPPKTEYIATIE